MSKKKFFDRLRRWIDGEEEVLEGAPPSLQSKWNAFFIAVARELSDTIEGEMFTPPGGLTYIPRRFRVFLNPEDDADWQGEKRRGLEHGLQTLLTERAHALAGENGLQNGSLTIEIQADPSVERNRFRIQSIWDERQVTTTAVALPPTKAADTASADKGAEPTVVRPRWRLSVNRKGESARATSIDYAFRKKEIVIGRGSAKSHLEVDLQLPGDLEVSRAHASVKVLGDDKAQLSCLGANAILLNDAHEISRGESVTITRGDKFTIGSYELLLK